MKKAHVIMGAGLAVFAGILYVNAYSELATIDTGDGGGVRMLPMSAAKVDNITVKSATGKFNYKDPASNKAQQVVMVTAECDVSTMGVSNLNQLSYINFASSRSGKLTADVDDGFYINTSGITKGTKLKQKFFPWDVSPPKSGGGTHNFSYGGINAKLKDGKFIFSYAMKLKNIYGEKKLQELDTYDALRNNMQTAPTYKSNLTLQTDVTLTKVGGASTTFSDTSALSYTARKTSASAKVLKPPTVK